MIAKNGVKYDLDARKDPCVGKGKHVKLLSAKQLCRMVKGKSKTILVTLQAIGKNSAPRNGTLSKRWESFLENYKMVFPDEQRDTRLNEALSWESTWKRELSPSQNLRIDCRRQSWMN
jgi:hypothetical protein